MPTRIRRNLRPEFPSRLEEHHTWLVRAARSGMTSRQVVEALVSRGVKITARGVRLYLIRRGVRLSEIRRRLAGHQDGGQAPPPVAPVTESARAEVPAMPPRSVAIAPPDIPPSEFAPAKPGNIPSGWRDPSDPDVWTPKIKPRPPDPPVSEVTLKLRQLIAESRRGDNI